MHVASKTLFQSASSKPPVADTTNDAGGVAYSRSAKEALTQYALTGCFGDTYYTSAQAQLDKVLELAKVVGTECPDYVAKLAVYSRTKGFMKDMPAILLASISQPENKELLQHAFSHVIDNGKMLRNYVQILRSGVTGRKSLGTLPKRLITDWILMESSYGIVRASVGNQPSLADIIKMVHPKPQSRQQAALFSWVIGKEKPEDWEVMPELVKQLRAFRADPTAEQPDVPFELLTSTKLTPQHWKQIAKKAGWQMLRMNLNTFLRNNVFADQEMVQIIADRLQDKELMGRARPFPYQCLTSFMYVDGAVPMAIKIALQKILDVSLENIPTIPGQTYLFLDVSGSMGSPITGVRAGATSKITCTHVAAMIAAALLKRNPETIVLPFDTQLYRVRLNPLDSIATMTETLAKYGGGGTRCGLPMKWLKESGKNVDSVIYVSDNESWLDFISTRMLGNASNSATEAMAEWVEIKRRNKHAKLICIDLSPNRSVQAPSSSKDILNVGGFSDNVFTLLERFTKGEWSADFWVKDVEAINL